jgi:hypothetical protein
MATKIVKLYVCPNGCDTETIHDGTDLEQVVQGHRGINFENRPKDVWHTRADCPACRTAGKGRVQRVLVDVPITLPAAVKPVEIISERTEMLGRPVDRPVGVRAAAA